MFPSIKLRPQWHSSSTVRWPSKAAHAVRSRVGPFGRDISVVLLIKAILLFLLWWACFRVPAPAPDSVSQLAAQRLLGPGPTHEAPHADP